MSERPEWIQKQTRSSSSGRKEKHPAAEKKAEDLHMEFNLVVFFIAIALVIIAAVIATVVAVSGGVSAAVHNKLDEEE